MDRQDWLGTWDRRQKREEGRTGDVGNRGPQAEALHTAPGFKPCTTLTGQASHCGGQGHSTHVHPLVLGVLVHSAGRDGRDRICVEQNCRNTC